jgi:hypothetical protein
MYKPPRDEWLAIGGTGLLIISLMYAGTLGVSVFNEIRRTASELETEMDTFKHSSEELWSELLKLGEKVDSTALRRSRQAYSSGVNSAGYGASLAVETPPPRQKPVEICSKFFGIVWG